MKLSEVFMVPIMILKSTYSKVLLKGAIENKTLETQATLSTLVTLGTTSKSLESAIADKKMRMRSCLAERLKARSGTDPQYFRPASEIFPERFLTKTLQSRHTHTIWVCWRGKLLLWEPSSAPMLLSPTKRQELRPSLLTRT